uniref:Sphingomyelin synthase-like domain-containing protein n=1 Tax=Setaria digitata TaxID=48799 RepID=A0A915Q6T0_9BILA
MITPNDIQIEKIYKPKRGPTFLATILLAIAWLANEFALAWVHDRIPRGNVPALPDLWFSLFPEVPVPSKKTYCAPRSNGSLNIIISRVIRTFWSAGIEQLRPRELCGDLIISGHTISIFIAALALKEYCPRRLYYLAELCYAATFLAVFCILLARKHYTIDVVLAYCLTTRVFWTYHSLSHSYHQGSFDQIPLNQSIWACMVPYLEADAPPPQYFLNRWKWPSDCPQRFRKR